MTRLRMILLAAALVAGAVLAFAGPAAACNVEPRGPECFATTTTVPSTTSTVPSPATTTTSAAPATTTTTAASPGTTAATTTTTTVVAAPAGPPVPPRQLAYTGAGHVWDLLRLALVLLLAGLLAVRAALPDTLPKAGRR